MAKFFRKPYKVELFKPRTEKQEFGLAKRGLILCPACKCIYFKKAWHYPKEKMILTRKRHVIIDRKMCPACAMIKAGQFEGEVIIKNIPLGMRRRLQAMIRAYGRREWAKECQHRVIGIKAVGDDLLVTTTENRLAARIAKKIKSAFSKVHVRIRYDKEPSDVARAEVYFYEDRRAESMRD